MKIIFAAVDHRCILEHSEIGNIISFMNTIYLESYG
jgi:hypothetical protein